MPGTSLVNLSLFNEGGAVPGTSLVNLLLFMKPRYWGGMVPGTSLVNLSLFMKPHYWIADSLTKSMEARGARHLTCQLIVKSGLVGI